MEPPNSSVNQLLSDVDVYDLVFQDLQNNTELVRKMQVAKKSSRAPQFKT